MGRYKVYRLNGHEYNNVPYIHAHWNAKHAPQLGRILLHLICLSLFMSFEFKEETQSQQETMPNKHSKCT